MIVCPKCGDTFDINDENVEEVMIARNKRWQHIKCPKKEDNKNG